MFGIPLFIVPLQNCIGLLLGSSVLVTASHCEPIGLPFVSQCLTHDSAAPGRDDLMICRYSKSGNEDVYEWKPEPSDDQITAHLVSSVAGGKVVVQGRVFRSDHGRLCFSATEQTVEILSGFSGSPVFVGRSPWPVGILSAYDRGSGGKKCPFVLADLIKNKPWIVKNFSKLIK